MQNLMTDHAALEKGTIGLYKVSLNQNCCGSMVHKKNHSLSNLDKYLIEFEKIAKASGITIH